MMGFTTKQVSSDVLDWSQSTLITPPPLPPIPNQTAKKQQQRINPDQTRTQSEPLKCPRCDSSNTKFCYYNNYNKSQPRHFCKACKRHWTLGGTLRNVPVGGGRKNKRFSKSGNGKAAISKVIQTQRPKQSAAEENRVSSNEVVFQGLMFAPPPPDVPEMGNFNGGEMGPSIFGQGLNFTYSAAGFEFPTPASGAATWRVPSSISDEKSVVIDDVGTAGTATEGNEASYWNWDDMDNFVSAADLNIPWDDEDNGGDASEVKP